MWANKVLMSIVRVYRCLKVGTLLGMGFMFGVAVTVIFLLMIWLLFALYLFT